MKQTLKQLQFAYYGVYLAALAAAISGFYLLRAGIHINPLSETGVLLNGILIVYIIGSVPITLAIFNKLTKKWALLPLKDERLERYKKLGTVRILIIGTGLVLGVVFFYIMQSQSMIFSAGIAAIALFFCKPSEVKMTIELDLDDMNLAEHKS
ncbi:MAG: hypothetical protein AUK44_10540 [Porphyromonadaceae bacterium CG2_30_38_12]|nr:MAG: hypothetical protein AUK44_10540 [Porphyromonadaceae bacterium CG2_30_38_12]